MGKCFECGKNILYNKYKMYRGKILCPECYDTRLERKVAKRAELKRQAELVKIVAPTKKVRKKAKKYGVTLNLKDGEENEEGKIAEDSR